jgi:modulator of FtsH protease HflC
MTIKVLASVTLILLWMSSALFTIDARNIAVVTSFGQPIDTIYSPGLHFKAPWPFHQIKRYDRRVQLLVLEPTTAFTKDTKNLVLTPFVLWQVEDPKIFLETLREVEGAEAPLSDVVTSRIASAIGEVDFNTVLSTEGSTEEMLPKSVVDDINEEVQIYGIRVQLVRLRHIGLPIQNEQSIYERMRAERSRIAKKYRSEGEEEALQIRAKADRDAVEIQATADRSAAELISKAEQEVAQIYAEHYRQSPDLYRLLIDLEATEASFEKGGTLIFQSDERPFSTLMENGR